MIHAVLRVLLFGGALTVVIALAYAIYKKQHEDLHHAYTVRQSEMTEEELRLAEDLQVATELKMLTNYANNQSLVYRATLMFNEMGQMWSPHSELLAKRQEYHIASDAFDAAAKNARSAAEAFQKVAQSRDPKLIDAARKEMYAAREELFRIFVLLQKILEEIRVLYAAHPPRPYSYDGPF